MNATEIRYLIARQVDQHEWMVVINPNWDTQSTERLAWTLLENSFNSYVEYENAGIVYRVVRNLEGYITTEE